MRHCGIDVHSTTSDLCELSSAGKVLRRAHFASTQCGFRKHFEDVPAMRVVRCTAGVACDVESEAWTLLRWP